jgi:hypothetical protein
MTKTLLILAYVLGSLFTLQSCSQAQSHGSDSYTEEAPVERPKTAAELRAELLEREQDAPETYLKTTGVYRRNFIDQLVLEGDIANTATLANFKDPVLTVQWFSKTHTRIDTKHYQIYELVPAKGSTHFKIKTEAPEYVESAAFGVLEATVVE